MLRIPIFNRKVKAEKRADTLVRPYGYLIQFCDRCTDFLILLDHGVEQAPVLERLIASHGLGQHSADLIQPLKAEVLRYALEGMKPSELLLLLGKC